MRGKSLQGVLWFVLLCMVLPLGIALAQAPPTPPPAPPTMPTWVGGPIKEVDEKAGTVTVQAFDPIKRETGPRTIVVDNQTQIVRWDRITIDEVKTGDLVSVQQTMVAPMAPGAVALGGSGTVSKLSPLEIKVSDAILISISDPKAVLISRQTILKLADLKTDMQIAARAEPQGDRLIAKSIWVTGAAMRAPVAPPPPPPAPKPPA